ncbi:Threonine/homoserine exporter RhtA [Corynebacterium occultum]|uniref:Threonine/homoserine exporter RhtA n=1 Tax=Corynebacterium occultum TaxID=2675219 RepID=A0A6B8WAC8_9CORY|nr:EamA family transporter [Corynebacterium occultum]QGU07796.1 Threonine/homoserine exporter RhtA [Corynebacterium occultum]
MNTLRSGRSENRLLAPAVMVVSGLSLYAGAAIAVGLFEIFPPVLVAWFRIAAAAVILLLFNRPRPRAFIGEVGFRAAVYGVLTLGMNMTFYEAIARLPMGTAVAIEFLGPILVAAWGSRSVRDWVALALGGVGVLVISGASWSASATGILFALAAGLFWAGYIVAGSRIAGDAGSSRSSIAVGFTWAAVLTLPLMFWLWPNQVELPLIQMIGLAAGLGLLSAAIPYSLDQVVLRLAGPAYFALLQAILPLVAALVGAFALGQWLSGVEIIGIVLVVAAVALRRP